MRKYIILFLAFILIPQLAHSQGKIDTLQIDQLRKIESITEIYSIPHTRYILDHFVFVRKTDLIDPEVQYNKGERISVESKSLLNRIKPGDTLIVKEVYALNNESLDTGLIKFPERKFLVE